jgi:hypothetical protein
VCEWLAQEPEAQTFLDLAERAFRAAADDERELCAVILDEMAADMDPRDVAKAVRDALASYRCAEVWTKDGRGMPLVDVLTPKGDETITRGAIEMGLLEDHILCAIGDVLDAHRGIARTLAHKIREGGEG